MANSVHEAFDFNECFAYCTDRKEHFHHLARHHLPLVAKAFQLRPSSFDLRSKHGGIVSGEIMLHSDPMYVQISQPFCAMDRPFVPAGVQGLETLGRLLERHPLAGLTDKAA